MNIKENEHGILRVECIIGLPPRTKKNSQQILRHGNRSFIAPSKAYLQYEKDCYPFLHQARGLNIDYPVNIKCLFYMPTRRKCDLTNLLEAVDDILTHYDVIADDNYTIVQSHDGSRVYYDKENPRTEILIERVEG